MGSAGEQSDKKWMVNRNRLLGEQRVERRASEQQNGVRAAKAGRGRAGELDSGDNCGVELRSRG